MRPNSLDVFLLISIALPLAFAQFCQYYGCARGYSCDSNTGFCRQFRGADTGTVGCGSCPIGTTCDSNTGRCVPFRNPGIGGGATPNCARVYCPSGYYCESSTGYCRQNSYRVPPYNPYATTTPRPYNPYDTSTQLYDPYSSFSGPSSNLCYGVVCSIGQQCDSNTGYCRPFRGRVKRQTTLCTGITCPSGQTCDSNTGTCQSFRGNGGVKILHTDDKCATVACPSGLACDTVTGNCIANTLRDDQCARVDCPSGYFCEASTGICQPTVPQKEDPCARLTCPQGTTCDSNTGKCRQFRPSADAPAVNQVQRNDPCSRIRCPQGTMCDSNTGMCRQFRPAADAPAVGNNCDRVFCPSGYYCQPSTGVCLINAVRDDPCSRLTCPQGTSCDSNTGLCRQFRPAADHVAVPPVNICDNMYCPAGTFCNPSTASCVGYNRDPTIPECPANSHWEPCASACPYSCTHPGDRCQLPCISTCVCNAGYSEASRTDLTCIPYQQCQAYNTQRCVSPTCGPNEVCVDDLCNSSLCPEIIRPALRPGCKYILTRNINQCLSFDLQCNSII